MILSCFSWVRRYCVNSSKSSTPSWLVSPACTILSREPLESPRPASPVRSSRMSMCPSLLRSSCSNSSAQRFSLSWSGPADSLSWQHAQVHCGLIIGASRGQALCLSPKRPAAHGRLQRIRDSRATGGTRAQCGPAGAESVPKRHLTPNIKLPLDSAAPACPPLLVAQLLLED